MSLTRGGRPWTPCYLVAIDHGTCIGCGRCYKVCPRDVLDLVERESADDDDYEDDVMMVMSIVDAMDCIGCRACARVCARKAQTHAEAAPAE